jgi:cbb3-type cytochrome oxidase subunit 3
MFRAILSELGGIGVYGILSTLLFFACFIGIVVWVVRMKKRDVDHMKHLPLEPDKPDSH